MLAKDIKRGHIVNYNDAPCMIETINVQSPSARGAATLYKFKARNLINKQKVDITLKGADSLNEADFAKRPVKYMYSDPAEVHFLDQEDYNDFILPKQDLEEELNYLTENLEGVMALIYNDQCVGIQLPLTVELKVVECDPGIKGASATARTKPAKLETGLIVQVPEYLSQGETVKVDTRNGAYISRA
ncbi:MAG: elongation factor P-like protein YeiP [Thermoguttaceae bacterium]|jgi:elongation factor P